MSYWLVFVCLPKPIKVLRLALELGFPLPHVEILEHYDFRNPLTLGKFNGFVHYYLPRPLVLEIFCSCTVGRALVPRRMDRANNQGTDRSTCRHGHNC